jgi:hypothetical protein
MNDTNNQPTQILVMVNYCSEWEVCVMLSMTEIIILENLI